MIGLALGILRFVPPSRGLKDALGATWRRRLELLACMLIACAPDIDFLFGLVAGDLNRYHQLGTHTILWALATAICIWLYGRASSRGVPVTGFWLVFALLASHLAVDYFTEDLSEPVGIMLAWPFSNEFFNSSVSVFSAVDRRSVGSLLCARTLRCAALEFIATAPLVAAAFLFKARTVLVKDLFKSRLQAGSVNDR